VGEHGLDGVESRKATQKALRIYAAWCVDAEISLLDELMDPRTLDDMFEPETARKLIRTLGDAREPFEKLLGPIPEDSDQELELDRRRTETVLRARRDRLLNLVASARLQPMLDRLTTRVREDRERGGRYGAPSFPSVYAIMNGGTTLSARGQLKEARLGFAYSAYSRDSLVLHGSALALSVGEDFLAPHFAEPSPSAADLALRVRDVLLRLAILRGLLPRGDADVG
jgi:hypothetical protein